MSALTEELPRKTIQAWRNFAQTPDFQLGIDWLRHNQAPKATGKTAAEMLEAALEWGGYMEALTDVEDLLTAFPKKEVTLEEPTMGGDGADTR